MLSFALIDSDGLCYFKNQYSGIHFCCVHCNIPPLKYFPETVFGKDLQDSSIPKFWFALNLTWFPLVNVREITTSWKYISTGVCVLVYFCRKSLIYIRFFEMMVTPMKLVIINWSDLQTLSLSFEFLFSFSWYPYINDL